MIHSVASVDDVDEMKRFCLGEIKKEKERENLDRLAHESNILKNTKFNTLPHQFELCEPKAHVSPCKGR